MLGDFEKVELSAYHYCLCPSDLFRLLQKVNGNTTDVELQGRVVQHVSEMNVDNIWLFGFFQV